MNAIKLTHIIFNILIIIFVIKGLLSEYGIVKPFDARQIYSFAYFGFAMAATLFFDRFFKPMENDEAVASSP